MRPQAILSARDITSGYGAVPVIRDVSVEAAPGEVALVIGPNGAGKSTLIKALNGELELMSGSVTLAGEDISRLTEDQRAVRGLGYVPQSRDVFGTLTVTENLEMGGYRLPQEEVTARVAEIFDRFPSLAQLGKRLGQTLSGGERKLLAIARALVAQPTALMLDEPTANLAPAVAKRVLGEVVAGLADGGAAVLLVEQRIALALDVASWVYVLVDGTPRFAGPATEFRALPDMGAVFFARDAGPTPPQARLRPSGGVSDSAGDRGGVR
jgi:branched-chain amino acid transport system ATP-binding protein